MQKPLRECKTAAERRENYPQLCQLAAMLERTGQPGKMLKAIAWIITQDRQEAAQDGKDE